MRKFFNTTKIVNRSTSYEFYFLIFTLIFLALPVRAEIVVITHPQTKLELINAEQIKKRWLSETKRIKNQRVDIIDISENNPLRNQFYSKVVGVSDNQLKAHWARKVFRGEGFPPEMKADYAEILRWAKEQPNRLGYLYKKDVNDSVKIIFEMH